VVVTFKTINQIRYETFTGLETDEQLVAKNRFTDEVSMPDIQTVKSVASGDLMETGPGEVSSFSPTTISEESDLAVADSGDQTHLPTEKDISDGDQSEIATEPARTMTGGENFATESRQVELQLLLISVFLVRFLI